MKASDEYGFQPAGRAAEAGGTGSKGERMMILADKLIELRKKNGWSQEDVAEKLDVSRQTISKWEGAQSVPDMNRIIRLSELYGVSTDFLLKDEMESGVFPWKKQFHFWTSGICLPPGCLWA